MTLSKTPTVTTRTRVPTDTAVAAWKGASMVLAAPSQNWGQELFVTLAEQMLRDLAPNETIVDLYLPTTEAAWTEIITGPLSEVVVKDFTTQVLLADGTSCRLIDLIAVTAP